MGFDILGRDPSSVIGTNFGMTYAGWTTLADYMVETVPEIAARCRWHYNDGDGLNALEAEALADALEAEIASGRCLAYARVRRAQMVALRAQLASLPDQPCSTCDGRGLRVVSESDLDDPFPLEAPVGSEIPCGRCNGLGSVGPNDPAQDLAALTPNTLREFVAFLGDSGGFSIW
jgi:hypothetical protein